MISETRIIPVLRNPILLAGELRKKKGDSVEAAHVTLDTYGCRLPANARPRPSDISAKQSVIKNEISLEV